LRAFEAAAHHLSFAKAARELSVTSGAISRQIKLLEDYLDAPLFRRLGRAVELTEIARSCLPLLCEGFDRLGEAMDVIRASRAERVLVLAVAPAFAARWLMPRLQRFAAAHPEIELRLSADRALIDELRHEAPAGDGEAGMRIEDADLTIRFGMGRYAGSRVDLLYEVALTPMCTPERAAGPHPLLTPDALRHHALLHDDTVYFSADEPDWAVWLRAAGVEGIDARRGPRFSHAALTLDAAAQGLGVVLGIPALAAADLAAGRLVAPFALHVPSRVAYYLVCPEAASERPEITAFRAWLLREVGEAAHTDVGATRR
jgi:LysR family glycine cleavage system transcriptional activator